MFSLDFTLQSLKKTLTIQTDIKIQKRIRYLYYILVIDPHPQTVLS